MYSIIKRFIDILIASIALIILAPLLIPVMIILRFTGEHKVFYQQERLGYKNRMFRIYKFVTMVNGSLNAANKEITLRDDPRILPFGKYLNMSKIDELPQLINVLIGDMSIVGPRPLMPVSFEMYPDEVKKKIYNSKPGLTGVGSIIFRDEEKMVSESGMDPREFYRKHISPHKGMLEMWYQENKSLKTDLLIILLTAWILVLPDSNLPNIVFSDLPKMNRGQRSVKTG